MSLCREVLEILKATGDPLSAQEIADKLNVLPTQVSGPLSLYVNEGAVIKGEFANGRASYRYERDPIGPLRSKFRKDPQLVRRRRQKRIYAERSNPSPGADTSTSQSARANQKMFQLASMFAEIRIARDILNKFLEREPDA